MVKGGLPEETLVRCGQGRRASGKDKGDGGRHQQEDQLTRARKVYNADDSVVARYSKSSLWYAAVVVDVREDGVIKIKWGDRDKVSS